MAFQIGTHYDYVVIDKLVWMVKNLDTDTYQNGDPIPNVISGWSGLTTGAYCYYDNDSTNGNVYGKLYNRYAVLDSRNIAPLGWRVATGTDWRSMILYMGGDGVAGGKLKETGFEHWNSPNTGATNQYGFTALPGGSRSALYGGLGDLAWFWFAPGAGPVGNRYSLSSTDTITDDQHSQSHYVGMSVRCCRDLY